MVAQKIGVDSSSSSWNSIEKHGFTEQSLSETLIGGQSFVWDKNRAGEWEGIIAGAKLSLRLKEEHLQWRTIGPKVFSKQEVSDYLWLDSSYEEAIDSLPWRSDPILQCCMEHLPGLRILKQPLDETLFYFLLSPVKSIPQIKETGRLVARMYGPELGGEKYGFPGWSALAEVPEEKFRELKLGYRARNVVATAAFLRSRLGWIDSLSQRSYLDARNEIMKLPGVGGKIADCVLLFGARKLEAFPIDTWIEKVLSLRYGLEKWNQDQKLKFAHLHFGSFAGLAQQFFFSAERLGFLNKTQGL